jgi:TorA maturation chaperone TorD
MSSPPLTDTRAELFRALGVLAEPPGPTHARLADLLGLPELDAAMWTEAFVVQLVPYASIYLGPEGMLGGEAADRIAGFWRALRLPVPANPDHLTALLGLYATLLEAEQREPAGPRRVLRRQARTALLHEHLLSWLLTYGHAMVQTGPPGYAAWADLLREALCDEAREVGLPDGLPSHLRDLPPLAADPQRLDDVLAGLLAPARCGLVLTRAHLAAAARHGGLGLRLGERRRVLRALVEQDPAGTLTAIAEQAQAWAARHDGDQPAAGPTAAYWGDRARATAQLLRAGAAAVEKENQL